MGAKLVIGEGDGGGTETERGSLRLHDCPGEIRPLGTRTVAAGAG